MTKYQAPARTRRRFWRNVGFYALVGILSGLVTVAVWALATDGVEDGVDKPPPPITATNTTTTTHA